MKIKRLLIPKSTIEEFAEQHDLIMEVRERETGANNPDRYYARFENAEAREGESCLIGLFGNGVTPQSAIYDYSRQISMRTLIIKAMSRDRREIKVPRLTPTNTP